MKKILAVLSTLFFVSFCFGLNLEEYKKGVLPLSEDGIIEDFTIENDSKIKVWGRTENKTSISANKEVIQFEYNGLKDYSINFNNEKIQDEGITISEPRTYILYAEVFVTKGTIAPSFVIYNNLNQVMNWAYGEKKISSDDNWQSCYALVTVNGQEQRDLVPVWMKDIDSFKVSKIYPRFVGDGATSVKLRNIHFLELKTKAPLSEEYSISNDNLAVSFSTVDQTMTVLDKRCNKKYFQKPGNLNGAIPYSLLKKSDGFELTLFDMYDFKSLIYKCKLSDDTLNCTLTTSDVTKEMNGQYIFPGPLEVSADESLILPINEGMIFSGDDKNMLTGNFHANVGHGMSMPFFGATDGNSSWMVVLDTSEDGGMNLSRRQEMNCASPLWNSECGKFGYERKFRYIFLDKDGYVGIAKRYRKIATDNGNLVTFTQKKQQRGAIAAKNIDKLRGAVNIWSWSENAYTFCSMLQKAGIKRILWSRVSSPNNVDLINEMGDVLSGRYVIFQDVMDPANFNKINYVSSDWIEEAFPHDIATNKDGTMVQAWPVSLKNNPKKYINCVSLCDITAPFYARNRISEDLKTHNYGAHFIDTTTASDLRECYNINHPMTRTQSKNSRIELLGIVSKEKGLVCGSETGADYAVPVCDYFEGMLSLGPYRVDDSGRNMDTILKKYPERITKFQLGENYRIPLWELVYHDCSVSMWYWGDYNNKIPAVWDKRDLFNALYACPPMFFITENSFIKDKKRFVQSYNASADITYATFDTEMTDHIFITKDRTVQKTFFANGVSVLVNFGNKDFIYNGKQIKAGSILVDGLEK